MPGTNIATVYFSLIDVRRLYESPPWCNDYANDEEYFPHLQKIDTSWSFL